MLSTLAAIIRGVYCTWVSASIQFDVGILAVDDALSPHATTYLLVGLGVLAVEEVRVLAKEQQAALLARLKPARQPGGAVRQRMD